MAHARADESFFGPPSFFLQFLRHSPENKPGGSPKNCGRQGEFYTMPDFIPINDNSFAAWLGNFNTVAENNLAALGLTQADLTPGAQAKSDFDEALTANVAAQAAAVAATSAKNNSRRQAEQITRVLARRIQANPAVPASVKEQLGLNVGSPISAPVVPAPPAALVVNGFDNGTNALVWKPGGNKSGTQYVIEAKIGGASAWQLLDVTTRTKWSHTGQRPGVPVLYRICARRGGMSSGCSNEAVVYGGM